jgi:hypothetical protein
VSFSIVGADLSAFCDLAATGGEGLAAPVVDWAKAVPETASANVRADTNRVLFMVASYELQNCSREIRLSDETSFKIRFSDDTNRKVTRRIIVPRC